MAYQGTPEFMWIEAFEECTFEGREVSFFGWE